MVSRRSFLKLTGLAAVAAGAGFGTGRMIGSGSADSGRRFAMHGFVPDDERSVMEFLHFFSSEVPGGGAPPVISADARWHRVIAAALRPGTRSAGPGSGRGRITVRLTGLGAPVRGDVLVSDDRRRIYDPAGDFSQGLQHLRESLSATDARCMLSVEYVEEAPLASLFTSSRVLVVENDRGVVDRIALDGPTRRVDVAGRLGRTGVTIRPDGAHVHQASCRHGLCRSAGVAARPGDVIACAPNGLILRVERA